MFTRSQLRECQRKSVLSLGSLLITSFWFTCWIYMFEGNALTLVWTSFDLFQPMPTLIFNGVSDLTQRSSCCWQPNAGHVALCFAHSKLYPSRILVSFGFIRFVILGSSWSQLDLFRLADPSLHCRVGEARGRHRVGSAPRWRRGQSTQHDRPKAGSSGRAHKESK